MYNTNAAILAAAAEQQKEIPKPATPEIKRDEFVQPEPEQEERKPEEDKNTVKIPTGNEPAKNKQTSPEKDKLNATVNKIKSESPKQPVKKEPVNKKPDPKPTPAKKMTPKKGQKPESDTISIPAAEAETPQKHPAQGRASVPPAEGGTPRKAPPPSRASVPPGEAETPKKHPAQGRASVPPAEAETPRKKPPQSAVSIPAGEPETPREQSDTVSIPPAVGETPRKKPPLSASVSIPEGEPETPRKVATDKDDSVSVPGGESETPKKQSVDKTKTSPAKPAPKAKVEVKVPGKSAAKVAEPKTPAEKKTPVVKTPGKPLTDKKKVEIKPTKLENKVDVKPAAGKTIPKPDSNPYDTYKHTPRNQKPTADSKTPNGPKKYGINAKMQQDEDDKFAKEIPNGRVIPFGYKSPPETPSKGGPRPEAVSKEGTAVSITPATKPAAKKPAGKPQVVSKPGDKTPRAGQKLPPKTADKNAVKSPPTARKAKVCRPTIDHVAKSSLLCL